jgi:glycosyltransferase involved in cell wall biosynthesis
VRLHIFATHPVQYHVPLWRALARRPELDVKVFYFNDQSVRGGLDRDFGVQIAWDVDLLSGYENTFLSRDAVLETPRAMRIDDVQGLLDRERPDWVMIAGYTHGFELQLVRECQRRAIPVLMRGEFSDLSFGPRPLVKRVVRQLYLRWFYGHIARFAVIGKGARAHLQAHGQGRKPMAFSPYSVDHSLIDAQKLGSSREQARGELGIPDDRFMLLLSGKLIPRKDPLFVLRTLEHLAARERVGLIAIGDGQLRDEFCARGRQMLADRFISPGFVNQSQLGRYFLAADALVLPSRYETWGLVVNEAMRHELPVVVSSQVGCAEDLVDEGQTGYRYRIDDEVELASKLSKLIEDPARSREMGQNAYRRTHLYSIEASAAGVLELLGLPSVAHVEGESALSAAPR